MAHLIKISDYTSRYEQDIQRYPSQFSRLKRERWQRMKSDWERANRMVSREKEAEKHNWFEPKERNIFSSTVARLKKVTNRETPTEENTPPAESLTNYYRSKSLEDLKEVFYEELFQAQLKWASSSLIEESSLDIKYKYDRRLRYLLRELPDNYMVMYYPIMKTGRANVEMDIVIISPTEVFTLVELPGKSTSIYTPGTGRYWTEYINQERRKVVSPLSSLHRMRQIIETSLSSITGSTTIKGILYAPEAMIDYPSSLFIEVVDKRNIKKWIEKRKRHPSPIKKTQLDISERLLNHSLTSAAPRQDVVEEESDTPRDE
ncbi:nuclease-related domain-containing protein [Alteribacillus iranensis]|nr:nuclease-related domain-containing protein [Alteribacillus iranensis]